MSPKRGQDAAERMLHLQTDKKTIEQSVELFDMKDFDIEIKKNAE